MRKKKVNLRELKLKWEKEYNQDDGHDYGDVSAFKTYISLSKEGWKI
ncbi:hypothetical protein [uncultured Maribacter sp.]|nr:hypothetical protein [uncultured Maribacter sp.]